MRIIIPFESMMAPSVNRLNSKEKNIFLLLSVSVIRQSRIVYMSHIVWVENVLSKFSNISFYVKCYMKAITIIFLFESMNPSYSSNGQTRTAHLPRHRGKPQGKMNKTCPQVTQSARGKKDGNTHSNSRLGQPEKREHGSFLSEKKSKISSQS